MNFNELIGQTFQEREFFDLLVFELEENFDLHSSKFPHFYFKRLANAEIQITEIKWFESEEAQYIETRRIVDSHEWYEFCQNSGRFLLTYIRRNRTGWISVIYKERTFIYDSKISWGDERPKPEPMTPEEIRDAFQDLMGTMQTETGEQKLNLKRSA